MFPPGFLFINVFLSSSFLCCWTSPCALVVYSYCRKQDWDTGVDFLCYFRSWSLPPDLSPDWTADCALCVGGMRWLACLLWGEPVLRPWGPRFRGVLYLGQTVLPPEALAFPGLFVPSGIWFFSWWLMPGCLWSMWEWGKQIAVPASAVLDTDLQLFPLSSAPLLSPAFPHTSGPEPGAISCSRPDWLSWFLLAFQQAFWLPAPLGCLVEYFGLWLSLPLWSINTVQPAFLILEISYIFHPLVNPLHPLSFDIRVSLFLFPAFFKCDFASYKW